MKDFFILAEKLPIAGFSVTIPHKQKIMRYLDVVDPLARRIGAVNTVWRKAGKWRGGNTDADAVTIPLSRKLRLSKSSVLVVGNGGAARSAAYALVGSGAKVSIVGRNPDRVRSLARACGAESLLREQMKAASSTPWSTPRRWACCRIRKPVSFPTPSPPSWSSTWCTTRWKPRCCATRPRKGSTVISGLQMFLEQASRQFEIWTGGSAPRSVMEKAAIEALAPAC